MRTQVLLNNVSTATTGSAVEIEASGISLYRVTVAASSHGTTSLEIQDPAGSWVAVPDASSTANDAYEVHLAPGDKVRGVVTGSPSGLSMYIRGIGRG